MRFRDPLPGRAAPLAAAFLLWCSYASAQTVSHQATVDARTRLFLQDTANDPTQVAGDLLVRDELFVAPSRWLQLAAGVDLRVGSDDEVAERWRFDVEDRRLRRPRLSLRRLSAALNGGGFSVDIGKQFIRWARTDVLNPMDRFAPRDFLHVVDSEFLPVIAVRPSLQAGSEQFEAVWTPQLTPSRMPLIDQRWTVLPPEASGITIDDEGFRFPRRSQFGARWRHAGTRLETGLAFFDGFNHLPDIEVLQRSDRVVALTRVFPRLRMYGGDFAIPAAWFTMKAEAGYFVSPDDAVGDYGLYVLEIERQTGEWLLTGGYAGEIVTRAETRLAFDAERGLARSFIGRAAYTVDPQRTVTVEGAVRRDGDGLYAKGEYSQAIGQYWRVVLAGVALAGEDDDFLGQFHRNSHVAVTLRFSF
jgi:hypothetical protein